MAKDLGVDKVSLQNWERGIYDPITRFYPAIIRFLGYVPFTHDGTPSGIIRWLRRCAGWTQKQLAAAAKCNDVTVWKWETGQPFDTRLRQNGLACLVRQLETLELTRFAKLTL